MESEKTLIRVFFRDGKVETRPADRIWFIKPEAEGFNDKFIKSVTDDVQKTKLDRVLINIGEIKAIQVFNGVFNENLKK